MKGKTSRKGTTTRTRGSKATIKSRVDQWITKRNTGNSWGMGGFAMEVELPKGKLGWSHAILFTPIHPVTSQPSPLISSP